MGQIYSFQDPLPLMFGDGDDSGSCFDRDYQGYKDYLKTAEDGWPPPPSCPICGTPYTTCVGELIE